MQSQESGSVAVLKHGLRKETVRVALRDAGAQCVTKLRRQTRTRRREPQRQGDANLRVATGVDQLEGLIDRWKQQRFEALLALTVDFQPRRNRGSHRLSRRVDHVGVLGKTTDAGA